MRVIQKSPANASAKPTIRDRAAALKHNLAAVFSGRHVSEVTDQPQRASLTECSAADRRESAFPTSGSASNDVDRGQRADLGRTDAARGRAPHREHDMGRHETFENAAPIADELMTGTMLGRAATFAEQVAQAGLTLHPEHALRAEQDRRSGAEPTTGEGRAETDAMLLALAPEWEARAAAYMQALKEQGVISDNAPKVEAPPPREPFEQWARLIPGWRQRTGVEDAEAATSEAMDDLCELEDRISNMPAATLAGLKFKARIAQRNEDVSWPEGLEESLVRDILAMGEPAVEADAELLRLGRQFEAARAREIAANEACNAAQDEAERHMPERPDCLIYRASDAALRVHSQYMMAEALEGRRVHASDIEWLKQKMPMHHEVLRPIRNGERGHRDHPGRKFDIVPHVEAQARAEEIVTAWEAWDAEQMRVHGEYVTEALDDAANAAGDATATLAHRIAALPAQSAEGFRVKIRALAHYNSSFFYSTLPDLLDPDQALSHSLWRDVLSEPQQTPAAVEDALDRSAGTDPILAAIAASRRAEAEMEATEAAFGGRQMTDAEQAREDAAERDQKDTRAAVWATVPTTAEGRAALAQYVAFQVEQTFGPDWRAQMEKEFCGDALLALMAAINAECAADAGPDGALVELAAKFCRVYALNNEIDRAMMAGSVSEEQWKPHYEATMNLARQLAATTPTTTVGMALKCLGPIGQLAWQVANEPDPARLDPHERIAVEFYAALRDGTLSPILPDPSSQSRLTPDRQWAVAQASAVDLTSLPVLQLHNLFEAFAEAADQWLALAHQPWADDAADNEFRRPTGAGRIVDREQDRAAEIRSRIADEIRSRKPLDLNEHDLRLETLIRYEIMCEGSLRRAPELRAEIAMAWGG